LTWPLYGQDQVVIIFAIIRCPRESFQTVDSALYGGKQLVLFPSTITILK